VKCFLIYCFFHLSYLTIWSQQSIAFSSLDLAQAMQQAKAENKIIFIDAYARYCKPCRLMEREFQNPTLAKYFNAHFINVKVNMDEIQGLPYDKKYDIIFLPTMLFVNREGSLIRKLDQVITARDLLAIGRQILLNPNVGDTQSFNLYTSYTPAPDSTFAQAKKEKQVLKDNIYYGDNEKIIYVIDQQEPVPSDILRKEAYFRMQLMDGSHHKAAHAYLDTQSDWLNESNARFLYDFLYTIKSKEFDFLIANRTHFEKLVGKANVQMTIKILVEKELSRGYPRPDFAQAKKLYGYLDPATADKKAARYIKSLPEN
jgi:thioredoxin-related protein